METLTKVLIGLGLVGALLVLRKGGAKIISVLRQNDPRWGRKTIGTSSSTLGSSGCMVTVLGMAARTLTGHKNVTPDQIASVPANFSGSALKLPSAAASLGMNAPDSERLRFESKPSADALRSKIDSTLSRGGLAIVHVDKDYTGTGDHFILVHGKSAGSYVAADPAPGTNVQLDRTSLTGQSMWGKTPIGYRVVGVAPIYKA